MTIILFVFSWMGFNVILALIAVAIGWMMLLAHKKKVKYLLFLAWLLFVPNTIYMLTDITHIFEEWNVVSSYYKIILVFMYLSLIVISLATFLLALYPFEKMMKISKRVKNNHIIAVILLNFAIGFAIMLGRMLRVNSWEVVTNIPSVTHKVLIAATSFELLLLAFVLGIIVNGIYFCTKNIVMFKLLRLKQR